MDEFATNFIQSLYTIHTYIDIKYVWCVQYIGLHLCNDHNCFTGGITSN